MADASYSFQDTLGPLTGVLFLGNEQSVQVSAKIIAEMLLGKIRILEMGIPAETLYKIREYVGPIKKSAGDEDFAKLIAGFPAVGHAFVAGVFDAVAGLPASEDTKKRLKELPLTQRTAAEAAIAYCVGGSPYGSRGSERWNHRAWALKRVVEQICATSISGIEPQEIRDGYDTLVHAVVDELYARWQTLVT